MALIAHRIPCSMKNVLLLLLVPLLLNAQDQKAVVEKYQNLEYNYEIFDIAIDGNNKKWLGTDRGLVVFSAINASPDFVITDTTVLALAADQDEQIWSGQANNAIYSPNFNKAYTLEDTSLKITCMEFFNGLLYIGTNNGLYSYNPRTNRKSRFYTTDNSRLPNNHINMLFADPYDQLWIGTDEGIVQMRNGRMVVLEKDHQFQAATHTREGVWLVSDKEIWVVNMRESKTGRWYPANVKRGLSKGQVRALAADSKGRIYLASEIVVQFDPYRNKSTVFDEKYGFISSQSLALVSDKNDDLWVGTGDEGIFRIDVIEGESEELTAIAFVSEEIKCYGRESGAIKLKVNGGKSPYSIKWNYGAREKTELTGMPAGIYTATITDAEGITYVATTEITQPDPIIITEVVNKRVSALRARDGELKVAVSGGTEPYTLRWNNGKRGVLTQTNVPHGEYTLTVIDANYCESEATFLIDRPKVLPQLDISTIEVGQTLRIEELFFEADSSVVTEESFTVLDEIHSFLSSNEGVIVEIGGHTNGIPPHEYCDRLSTDRARNVAEYLYQQGITQEQIVYKGYGKRKPIATNMTKQGRQKNQRVELKILGIKNK